MGLWHDRLAARYTAGLRRPPTPALFPDPRSSGALKPAAVLLAVTEREQAGLLLLHRPSHMRAHAGQVALPGGRLDAGETVVQAALREAEEELGLDPTKVRVIGPLAPYHTGSGYAVTPVLATIPPDLPITPNPDEVAQWFEAPLDYVLNPAHQIAKSVEWQGAMRQYVEILWQGHRIWGVTGAILANLSCFLDWNDKAFTPE
ncbi:CoA pyrophosphatase [Novosphingobium umbonatum]|uniref:CoA pyrophosphatase n=1 Tax=Novosphingobium umbonatum TaxID=1908524 RepID=A0A437N902_9SPHN|nr:CoA pyrophosphatase [Novosphingobium umbonatum]RVU06387.1 CoA pyrophosphatase [Novosphingobium umbonatum]